jgi:hypothetical protein
MGLKERLEANTQRETQGETQRGLPLKLCWTDFRTCPNLGLLPDRSQVKSQATIVGKIIGSRQSRPHSFCSPF